MKKRILSMILALVMLFSLLPAQAFATEIESAVIETEEPAEAPETASEPENLTPSSPTLSVIASGDFWTLYDDGKLVISGEMGDYGYENVPWYEIRSSIKSVEIKSGVSRIGDCAFVRCDDLVDITIPNSVTSIGDAAFYYCLSLKSITIPNSVTSIGDYAFDNCDSLTSVTIPDGVTSIGMGAFHSCSSLTSIQVDKNNAYYSSKDGVLYNKSGSAIICCPGGMSGRFIIPNSVTSIGSYAFSACESLTSITIPNSVTSIELWAFAECRSLKSITIPNSVTSIGINAFGSCSSLTDVTISDSVTVIGFRAFDSCRSLKSITIPDSVTSIVECAFYYCVHLTSITIPNSVTSIGDEAFEGCTSLADVYYSGSEAEYNMITIGFFNEPLLNATWHYNSTAPDDEPFSVTINNFKYKLAGTDPSRESSMTVKYTDEHFLKSSTEYNHELAKQSLQMAAASFPALSGEKSKYIRSYYEQTGFDPELIEISPNYNRDDNKKDEEEYSFAAKKLAGTDDYLVAVTVRSNAYGAGWAGNFRVGASGEWHYGFYNAGKFVYDALIDYLKENNIDKSHARVWVSGFSRGAATANVVGYLLNNGGFTQSKVFVYTFATPKTHIGNLKANNVFNIVSEIDPVPQVPLKYNWRFDYYGTTKILPAQSTINAKKYNSLLNNASSAFGRITKGEKYTPYDGQEIFIARLLNYYLQPEIGSRSNYASKFQKYLVELGYSMSGSMGFDWNKFLKYIGLDGIKSIAETGGSTGLNIARFSAELLDLRPANSVGALARDIFLKVIANVYLETNVFVDIYDYFAKDSTDIDTKTLIMLADCIPNGETSHLLMQHWPESYMAWLEAGTPNELFEHKGYSGYSVKCPVDVEVYDASGELVARVVNDEVDTSLENSLLVFTAPGGEKEIIVPQDEEYTVIITSRESDAEMDVVVTDYDESGVMENRTVFFDVPLEEGQVFTSIAAPDEPVVMESSGEPVSPDAIVDAEAFSAITVEAIADGEGTVYGGGSYTLGDTVALSAIPDEGNVFLGWFDGEELVSSDESYRFSARENKVLTARFMPELKSLTLDRDYIALSLSDAPVTVTALVEPEAWQSTVTWSLEENNGAVSVDANGTVTPLAAGTDYVVATVAFGEAVLTARCRVDVTADEVKAEVASVQLGETKLTSELYSADYAALPVLLVLRQNLPGTVTLSVGEAAPENNGVAIDSARFTDGATDAMFALSVRDDNTLLIVPREAAMADAAAVKSAYSSSVTVTVDGEEYVTAEALALSVKKSVPKLKAAAVTLNSFYPAVTAAPVITGAEVVGIEADALPAWLTLDDGRFALTDAAGSKTASASVKLRVNTAEWRIPAEVTVKVTNKYAPPAIKLAASSVTLSAEGSAGAVISVKPSSAKLTLADFNFSGLTAPKGFTLEPVDIASGTFRLLPAGEFAAGKITLYATFSDTNELLPLTLTVKKQAVSLKAAKSSVTLNPAVDDIAEIAVTATPADHIIAPAIRVTDAKGADASDMLSVSFTDGVLSVGTNAATPYGASFKVYISSGSGKEAAITVKTLKDGSEVSVSSVKLTGTLDLTFPNNSVLVTPSFKNLTGAPVALESFTVTDAKTGDDATSCFDLTQTGKLYELSFGETAPEAAAYMLALRFRLPNGEVSEKSVKLTVKRTAVSLKLTKSSVTLNKAVNEAAEIGVSCALKGYALGTPVISVLDKSGKSSAEGALNVSYANGILRVQTNESTAYGETYKITLAAEEGQKVSTVTVKTLAKSASTVTASLKLKGTLDIARSSSTVTVTAAYKNATGAAISSRELQVLCGTDGKSYPDDVSEQFTVTENADGSFTLALAKGAAVDPAKKYALRLTTHFECGMTYASGLAKLTVKSGSASVKAQNVTLYAKDALSRSELSFTYGSADLNRVCAVEIADAKNAAAFSIYDLGNGTFAVGFGEDAPPAGKTVKLKLNVRLEGNCGAKPSAVVTLSVKTA